QIGSIVSATLIEDALLTSLVSVYAARIGFRKILLLGSFILIASGLIFAANTNPWIIAGAAVLGIISPAGYEGGPFGAIEQVLISQHVPIKKLAGEFSNYNLIAFAGAALGSLMTGYLFPQLKQNGALYAYSFVFSAYALCGLLMAFAYLGVKEKAVAPTQTSAVPKQGIAKAELSAKSQEHEKSKSNNASVAGFSKDIWKLSFLQGMDAFGGGFVPTTLISYWFFERFSVGPEFTGPLFFITNLIAAISFVISPFVCKRFGLLNTMVFTHLPCSITLSLVPFMPTAVLAAAIFVGRSFFSSMDIPARQAFAMVLVSEAERPRVAGLTSAARSIGQCAAPIFSGWALANTLSGLSFVIAGACKTVYDISIYFCFRKIPLQVKVDAAETEAA
ncbi:MAG: MFS transporter, partial [Candidatus Obscuribacterales bacterium]|nr:MFS transporter [Candidatus Obscuribacterales bacterium]